MHPPEIRELETIRLTKNKKKKKTAYMHLKQPEHFFLAAISCLTREAWPWKTCGPVRRVRRKKEKKRRMCYRKKKKKRKWYRRLLGLASASGGGWQRSDERALRLLICLFGGAHSQARYFRCLHVWQVQTWCLSLGAFPLFSFLSYFLSASGWFGLTYILHTHNRCRCNCVHTEFT